jgi:predicted Zn-dependent protease
MKKRLILAALLLLVGSVGLWLGRPVYRQWKQDRLLARAQEAMARGDLREAGLAARQVLKIHAGNVEACRLMARITESLRLPAALEWWQRVVDLAPSALSNRLELARCSLLEGDPPRAARALQAVPPDQQTNAAWHQMAALVAVSLNRPAEAEEHLAEAQRLDPTNRLTEVNRAILRLQARDPKVAEEARRALEQFAADAAVRPHALRHLAMAALREGDFRGALRYTRQLVAEADARFADRLLHLQALRRGEPSAFEPALAELQRACANDIARIRMLAAWLLEQGLASEAERWLETLPADAQRSPAVLLTRAECLAAQTNWSGAQTLLQGEKWGEEDFLRQALLARACRELHQEFAAQSEWRGAVRAAAGRARALGALAQLAGRWGWEREHEEALWLVVERHPGERWALQALSEFYLARGDTRGLQRVYSKALEYNPSDYAARNNLASVMLLLNVQPQRAHELAREAWSRATTNAAFAATYAWSLHVQGRTAEGLRVFEGLPRDRLEIPGVALYYGLMLAAMRETNQARKFLAIAETGPLLPEEKSLLAEARAGL